MKIKTRRHLRPGFSLMELLVVVSLIIILAALTMVGFNLIQQKTNRDKAKVQLGLISTALEEYKSENRTLPVNEDSMGAKGSEVLFKALYQDGFEAQTKVYLPSLNPEQNKEGKGGQQWIRQASSGGPAEILDPWGHAFLYRTGANTQNGDFDLWSAGPDGKTNADPKHKDCKDDISNFTN